MNENENGNKSFDLMELVSAVWKFKFWVIAFVLIVCVAMGVKLKYFTHDRYHTDINFYLKNYNDIQTDYAAVAGIRLTDITAARTFGESCTEILKRSSFFNDVAKDADTNYRGGQISGMTSISTANETEVLTISVVTGSKKDTYNIANSIAKLAPKKIKEVTGGGSFTLLDEVSDDNKLLKQPSIVSKRVIPNLMLSAIVAFVISCGVIFLFILFDKKVHKGDDVAKRYGISILGEISK